MKIRQILLSALCALFAVSCVQDATEDVYIGPEGQTYFNMSFSTEGATLGTKVGFDPTGESGSYLFWSESEDIEVMHVISGEDVLYSSSEVQYNEPKDGETNATFEISSFEVPQGATDISIYAMAGYIKWQADDKLIVAVPDELSLTHYDDGGFDYDTYALDLPFLSPIETNSITTTADGLTSYDDGVPTLTMVPFFRAAKILMSNIDTSRTEAEVGYIKATITLGSNYFIDWLSVDPAKLSFDGDVNAAVNGAITNGSVELESKNQIITTTVSYETAQSFADLQSLQIPLVSLQTNTSIVGKNFTVNVEFYDNDDDQTLLASCERTYVAKADFGYGEFDDITPTAEYFEYDLNKAQALSDFEVTAQGIVSPEVLVEWTYPADVSRIEGVTIYYGKVDGDNTIDYTSVLNVAKTEDIVSNGTGSYTLGTNETLDWSTEYSIYVVTTYGTEETVTTPTTATTVSKVDIRYNADTDIYEIYSAKGLVAFSFLVRGRVNDDETLVATTTDGSTFPNEGLESKGEARPAISAQVMTTIDMAGTEWLCIIGYEGEFDGGNGGATPTGISIKNLTSTSDDALFHSVCDGAVIKNTTLTDVNISSYHDVGAIANWINQDATVTISYCEVSGVVSQTDNSSNIGGFVASVGSGANLTIENSKNSAKVEIKGVDYNSLYGFVGSATGATLSLTDCVDTQAGESITTGPTPIAVTSTLPNANYDGINVRWDAVEREGSDDVVLVYYQNQNNFYYNVSAPVKLSEGVASVTGFTKDEPYNVYVVITNYLWNSVGATDGGTAEAPLEITVSEPDYDIAYDTTNEVYEIYTADGLMTFAGIVNSGIDTEIPSVTRATTTTPKNSSADAKIMASINMEGKEWTPMRGYEGDFDGGSESYFEIQNLTGENGLFESISDGATISNVTLVAPAINNTESGGSFDMIYVGAIAGETSSDTGTAITNCKVKGGSVAATALNAAVGALVGWNDCTISNSTSSCVVKIGGSVFNGGTDSCLVGVNGGMGTVENCTDEYTEGVAAPDAEAATIATAIPMYTAEGTKSSISVTVSYDNGKDYVHHTEVMYKVTSDNSPFYDYMEEDNGTYTASGLTADEEYEIYVETFNYVGKGVKSTETIVTTYGADTYDSETPPAITAEANGTTKAITLTWSTDALSEYLHGFSVTYNGETETIDATALATGSATLTATYNEEATTLSYAGLYAPLAVCNEKVAVDVADAVQIAVETYDITLVNGTYEIYTEKGLLAFAQIVNGVDTAIADIKMGGGAALSTTAVADADAKVMAYIDLSTTTWLPIANYAGLFDGGNGGEEVTEIEIIGLTGSQGLFASTADGATIKNVTLSAEITATADYTGILVSTSAGGTISYCNTYGSIDGGKQYTSGIVGKNAGKITIEYCTNNADVTGSNNIAGMLGGRSAITYIKDCSNYGDITATEGSAGGVSGYGGNFSKEAASCEITGCYNSGYISATTSAGGIFGTLRGGKVTNCQNDGTISGGSSSAGIVGISQSYTVIIDSSSNNGIVHVTGDYAGGILGTMDVNTTISGQGSNARAVNSASATATGIGGIVGCITDKGTLSGEYYNDASVTLGGTLSLGEDGIDDDEITGGKAINNLGCGVVGSGSAEDRVTGECEDYIVTDPTAIDVTKFEVSSGNEAIYDIAWTYDDDDASSIADVVIYTKTTGDYAVANTIEVNGDNSVNSTTLTFAANSTNYVYLMSSNVKGEVMATTSLTLSGDGALSAENPLTAVIADVAIDADMTYDANTNTYSIHKTKGFLAFANLVNGSGNTGSAIVLNSDNTSFAWPSAAQTSANAVVTESISLTGETWTPMVAYAGTFDGGNGGATPTEIEITGLAGTQGLFTSIDDGAEIKNITITVDIQGASSSTSAIVGMVVTSAEVSVSHCTIYGKVWANTTNNKGKSIGGAIGDAGSSTVVSISNITNNATIQGSQNMGGIVGAGNADNRPTITFTDCTNNGEIAINTPVSTIGGIYGYGPLNTESSLTRCKNTAPINGTNAVGGLIGNINSNNGDTYITDCSNSGAISGTGDNIGGLVGGYHKGGNYTINDSTNTGVITTDATVVGAAAGLVATITISNFTNSAAVYNNTSTLVNGAGGVESIVGSGTAKKTDCTDSYYNTANE